jgi:single-strand DNA-binding protein
MSGSLNKVMLIGRLGADPEIRDTKTGGRFATFSLATSERWKDKSGEQQERTEWNRVVVFQEGLIPVIEQYVTKGSNVFIEGKLQTRKYEDKDGVEKYTTEVVLQGFNSTFTMLDSKSSESGAKPTTGGAIDDDDGIPF